MAHGVCRFFHAFSGIALVAVGVFAFPGGVSPASASPTPTPSSTPLPTATPTPTLTPTPDWALKILDVPTVLDMVPDGTSLPAIHNGLVPDGVSVAALGFWSRELQPTTGPWRFHGLVGYAPPADPTATVTTTTTWPEPTPGVVYELSARYRFDGSWDGPFFYFTWIDPEGPTPTPTPTPGPEPKLLEVFLLDDPAGPEIVAISNGFVSYPDTFYNMGLWYRQRHPPTPWTYMGTFPYNDGQTEVSQPLPLVIEDDVLYEVAARIRTRAGWATPFLTNTYQRPVDAFSATYLAFLRAGNTPLQPIGVTGTGIDTVPASRLALLFEAGEGDGPAGSTLATVTFTESLDALSGLPPGPMAPIHWHLSFDRKDWEAGAVHLYLTPSQLFNLDPAMTGVYRATSPDGPWQPLQPDPSGPPPGVAGGLMAEAAPDPDTGLVELFLVVGETDPVEVVD